MALTQPHPEIELAESPPSPSLKSSVKSLQIGPTFETSFDSDVLSERDSNISFPSKCNASFNSRVLEPPRAGSITPLHTPSLNASRNGAGFPPCSPSSYSFRSPSASRIFERFGSVPPIPSDEPSYSRNQTMLIDEIVKTSGTVTAIRDNIATWAPTAHSLVVAAAALQRDAAAFASSLRTLFSKEIVDPNAFASQYYQLREAYSSLLSRNDVGHQLATPAVSKSRIPDLAASWDDRQLVDSFMTLLRTSPGFIASAFMAMSPAELASFCASGDGTPLSTLFHGVLGAAGKHRPRILVEVLRCMPSREKYLTVLNSFLDRFFELAIGNLTSEATVKLERYITSVLAEHEPVNFALILGSCVPAECMIFVQLLREDKQVIMGHLHDFTRQLLRCPRLYGLLPYFYIDDTQKQYLQRFALTLTPSIEIVLARILTTTREDEQWFFPDELITVKGSDIIQLYNSLLPSRMPNTYGGGSSSVSASSATRTNSTSSSASDDDEWCLENIRADLVPVMRGLTHSTVTKTDGWQIFKVGSDGLVTDIGSDMGLISNPADECVDPRIDAVCDAVAHYTDSSVGARIDASRQDALLRGDHVTMFHLQEPCTSINESHVDSVKHKLNLSKLRLQYLRKTLDQAANEQRKACERLTRLVTTLDAGRVHVWYECEARLGSPYYKSRDFLQVLYPNEEEKREEASSSTRSRRLSILSLHSGPESPFWKDNLKQKLTDKEVDVTLGFMRHNRVRNIVPSEERLHRALVETGILARKLLDRDHLASYISFKRDRHYQTLFVQQQSSNPIKQKRQSHHHRRSSLGLFDFFDNNGSNQALPLTLHTSTSTQYLGLATSYDSLRHIPSSRESMSTPTTVTAMPGMGPPKWPTLAQVQALVLSDLGREFVRIGSETDMFMQQTGRMLLEGDGSAYQPLLDEIAAASSAEAKLSALESLITYVRCYAQRSTSSRVSRADIIHELSRVFGREPGHIYRDLQIISTLVNPAVLDDNDAFDDVCEAARNVLDLVVVRGLDYAARFLRYSMEITSATAPKMAMIGINDAVTVYAFCAKQGNPIAQKKLGELYMTFQNIGMEVRPLSRASAVLEGCDSHGVREAVAMHWVSLG